MSLLENVYCMQTRVSVIGHSVDLIIIRSSSPNLSCFRTIITRILRASLHSTSLYPEDSSSILI